jgi:hypothetical protein
MANVTSKLEILVDLSKPVEEIQVCIMVIANSNQGKQLEILQQVDLWLGEHIGKIEQELKKQQQVLPVETTKQAGLSK